MKALVVLTFEIPDDGVAFLADIVQSLNPPRLPFFAGVARVTIDPVASLVEEWLDED